MPEFQASKPRSQKSRTAYENNKNVCKYAMLKPQPAVSQAGAHETNATVHSDSPSTSNAPHTNSNLKPICLPANNQGTIGDKNVTPKNAIELPTPGYIATKCIQPTLESKLACSTNSISTRPIAHEQNSIENDTACESNNYNSAKLNASVIPTADTDNQHNSNLSNKQVTSVRRNLSMPVTGQPRPRDRSSHNKKPINAYHMNDTKQRDFTKQHKTPFYGRTGYNRKRHISSGPHQVLDAPSLNMPMPPMPHLLFPNAFSYSSQIPQLYLPEHQRLQMWNNAGCVQNSSYPLDQGANATHQPTTQFQDRNYKPTLAGKFARIYNEPTKPNRLQNRFKPRKYNSVGSSETNASVQSKNQAHLKSQSDIAPCQLDSITSFTNSQIYLQSMKDQDITNVYRDNTNGIQNGTSMVPGSCASLTELSSLTKYKDCKQIDNKAIRDSKNETLSHIDRISDMERRFKRMPQAGSNSREISSSNATSNNASFKDKTTSHNSVGRYCRSAILEKERHEANWNPKYNTLPRSVEQPTNAMTKHLAPRPSGRVGDNDLCKISGTHISSIQTLPPHFDPTVHPLQVFQNGQRLSYNTHHFKQVVEKPLLESISAPPYTLQKSNVQGYDKVQSDINMYKRDSFIDATSISKESVGRSTHCIRNASTTFNSASSDTIPQLQAKKIDCTSNTINTAYQLSSTNATSSLTINDEIEEEMTRAQEMLIPVKITSDKCSPSNSRLNPQANEFSPVLTDGNGNQFTMIKQKGVCYFHKDPGNSDIHSETNIAHEHEVAEILVRTSDSIYSFTANNLISKQSISFPTQGQNSFEYADPNQIYNDHSTQPLMASLNLQNVAYKPETQLPIQYFAEHNPQTVCVGMPNADYSLSNTYIKDLSVYASPAQTHAHFTPETLLSSDVNIQQQSPFTNTGYTLCSIVPMYVTPSPMATASVVPLPVSEYSPVIMQTPVTPGVPFVPSIPIAIPVPDSQHQPQTYTAIQQIPSESTQSHQAPVFNLHAYYEATQNTSSADHNQSDNHVVDKDIHGATARSVESYVNVWQKNEPNTNSGNAHTMMKKAVCETSEVNAIYDKSSDVPKANGETESQYSGWENKDIVPAFAAHEAPGNDANLNTPEFVECRLLLERLRSRKVPLHKSQLNGLSESENQRRRIEEWLDLALRIIEGSENKLTIDEMVRAMLINSSSVEIN